MQQPVSADQLVSLPPDALNAGQQYEVINLLATIARAALPGKFPGSNLERDLEVRFSGLQAVGLPDATAWLSQIGAQIQPLDGQVTSFLNGDPEQLHQALQQGNNTQQLQLLAMNDASKLLEIEDTGEMQFTSRPMAKASIPCLLLRLGYNSANGYAYYAASLPGDSRRPIKITWDSIVAAGVSGAVAILPPAKPVDMDRVANSLHIIDQALEAARQARADILEALGQTAPAAPAVTEQAV